MITWLFSKILYRNRTEIEIIIIIIRECFTGKYTTHKIQAKLHPGPEWRIFYILTSEYIDDVISGFFAAVCVLLSVRTLQFS